MFYLNNKFKLILILEAIFYLIDMKNTLVNLQLKNFKIIIKNRSNSNNLNKVKNFKNFKTCFSLIQKNKNF